MCRNIRTLYHFDPPVTDDEIRAASLQFVRKVSGFTKPSAANQLAFDRAVTEVSASVHQLLTSLVTSAPPKDREVEAAKARARSAKRFPAVILAVIALNTSAAESQAWPVHSMDRPRPPIVHPGPERAPVPAPTDSIVLFNGDGLDAWQADDSIPRPAGWKVAGGYMEVVAGSGSIRTRRGFGDVQLHIEWRAPAPPAGDGQNRGNSGVFLMGRYEVQVLDSWHNDTYPDGQAAALYGQHPPLVNAARTPGQWQTYDIIFRRPRFETDGALLRPARATVIHDGIVVQDAVSFKGATAHAREAVYQSHPNRLPLGLQDHDHPVRFRNIWVRELPEE